MGELYGRVCGDSGAWSREPVSVSGPWFGVKGTVSAMEVGMHGVWHRVVDRDDGVQGYLAQKKMQPPRTLP